VQEADLERVLKSMDVVAAARNGAA
jgi:hypothetical protein